MVQLTNDQQTCELVFKPKADVLNIRCDYQFFCGKFCGFRKEKEHMPQGCTQ